MSRGMLHMVSLAVTLVCIPPFAGAGFFTWSNPAGGEWAVGGNWQPNSYPRYFWDFASFAIDGTYEVDATGVTSVSVALINIAQGNVNLKTADGLNGTIRVLGPASLFLSQGTVRSSDAHQIGAGGSLIIGGGAKLVGGSNRNYAVEVASGASMFGNGVVDGNVVRNFGVLSPGAGSGQVGALSLGTVSGGLEQRAGGSLVIEIAAAGHDQITSLQTSLAGHLEVVLVDGFIPQAGDRFQILTSAAVVNGGFDSIAWPEGADFSLEYGSNGVDIVVTGVWSQGATVSLDIKPESCPNPVNTKSRGILPVALMFPPETNLKDLDPASIFLSGVPALRIGFEDVSSPVDSACGCEARGPDGIMDVVLKFDIQAIVAILGNVTDGQEMELEITGTLPDGTTFSAQDCIRILAKKGKSKGQFAAEVDGELPQMWQDSGADIVYFNLPEAGEVRVTVLDIQGRLVEVLTEGFYGSGEFSLPSAGHMAQGVYFYRMETEMGVTTAKVINVRR